jgi:predicted dehydrogenase
MSDDTRSGQSQPPDSETTGVTRRNFVATTAAATAGFMIVPRHVLGRGMRAPSDVLNIATVGINGMGGNNTAQVMGENVVAICDCDFGLLEGRLKRWQDSLAPNTGGGGGGGNANRAPSQDEILQRRWQNFGPSNAQKDANTKWSQTSETQRVRRFVEEQLPKLQKYRDYREMLEKQKDIDAVIVATPDHMHAAIASAAMSIGKHVYVQKPMCWSVHEARHLAKKAAETKVVTQMGNQGHSQDEARRGQDYLAAKVIGDVTEVHVWTNRPLAFWPQGLPRPAAVPPDTQLRWSNRDVTRRLAASMLGDYPIPEKLSWDLFLGVAPNVTYHPIYHPFNWRGWVDWGQGALGDMGAHLIDHPVWGLELGLPTVIETTSTPFNGYCYPNATKTDYQFPARKGMPAVKLVWYDGGLTPPRPEELGEEKLNGEGGILYVGTKGKMLQQTYGARPRLLPFEKHNEYGAPKEKLARIPHQSHEMNWVNAIKGTDEISCPFSYAAHLTEIMLLGVVSLRAGKKLYYEPENMRITNGAGEKIQDLPPQDANDLLTRKYREGWSL